MEGMQLGAKCPKCFFRDGIETKGKKHWVKSTHHLTELWAEGEGF